MEKENRYLTLQGYPLHKPLWQVFHQAAGVIAPVLAVGATIAIDQLSLGGHNTASILGHAVPSLVLFTGWSFASQAVFLNRTFGLNAAKNLCIDTAPDNYTPPTSMQNIGKSQRLKTVNLIGMGVNAAFLGLFLIDSGALHTTGAILSGIAISSSVFLPNIGDHLSAALRFNRVVNGKSVLTEPPPKKIEQKVTSGLLNRIDWQAA
jgi:hypothetical protein